MCAPDGEQVCNIYWYHQESRLPGRPQQPSLILPSQHWCDGGLKYLPASSPFLWQRLSMIRWTGRGHWLVLTVAPGCVCSRLVLGLEDSTNGRRALRTHGSISKASSGWGCYEQGPVLASFTRQRFPFCAMLEEGQALLYWDHHIADGHTTGGNVTLALVARVSVEQAQWVALGLAPEAGGMKGMDVAMLWTQEGVLEDRWSEDYSMPVLDQHHEQDKVLLEWVSKPDRPLLAFAFSMPISPPCPREDAAISHRQRTFVSWAYGAATPVNIMKNGTADTLREPAYHGPSGKAQGPALPLLVSTQEWQRLHTPVSLPRDAKTVTIALPGKDAVPSDRTTTYMCIWVQPPSEEGVDKYHIYSASLVGDPDVRRQLVHHIDLYTLGRTTLPPEVPGFNVPYDCTEHATLHYGFPFLVAGRSGLLTPSDAVYEAADAAIPFGRNTSNRLWVLEVHYNNPDGIQGIYDAAGYQLTYSSTLRTHDAGLLATGAFPTLPHFNATSSLSIPPGLQSYHHWDLCASACLTRRLAVGRASILGAVLHMHTLGQGGELRVEHADGTVDVVYRRDNWDMKHEAAPGFYGQGASDRTLRIGPGDRILTRCSYQSLTRTNTTRWGSSLRDEMCLGALFITPVSTDDTVCYNLQGVHEPTLDYFSAETAKRSNKTDEGFALCVCVGVSGFADLRMAKDLLTRNLLVGHSPADAEALRDVKLRDDMMQKGTCRPQDAGNKPTA